jgi:tetratricopeptide (TPR) repeat protein
MTLQGDENDYKRPALRETIRILAQFPAREQIKILESNPSLAQQSALWYAATRVAFRSFDYEFAIEAGQRGLNSLKVPPDQLPATTDPGRTLEALKKIRPPAPDQNDGSDTANLSEIAYVVEASREILRYETYLNSIATERPEDVARKVRTIVLKYSVFVDEPKLPKRRPSSLQSIHKDLRQAVHLIDMALKSIPKNAQHARLREWLYYRKVRILAQFDPKTVPDAVAAMEGESPKSSFMDDALAEELYAEGVRMTDVNAAQRTFQKLLDNFPGGNAVDNAYTWMAITYRCAGHLEDAQRTNRDIVRLFPQSSRHVKYARQRLANPKGGACESLKFSEPLE